MNIAIATIYTPNIQPLADLTVEANKRQYCDRHGYSLEVKTSDFPCQNLGFAKIAFLIDLLKSGKYDWIFWTGADTLITNFTIKIEDLIDEKYHFIIACDLWDFNADSFLIRNSPEGIKYLEHIFSLYDQYVNPDGSLIDSGKRLPDGSVIAWAEQGAMTDLKKQYSSITKVVPQKVLNSYEYGMYNSSPWHMKGLDCFGNIGQWTSGDFLIHWPGLSNQVRIQLAEYFSNIIIK